MPNITSAGIGSGLDVNGLLEQIVAAERAPTENRINRREADYSAKLTALGSFKGALSSFQSSLSSLKLEATFNTKTATAVNPDLVSITTTSIAQPGSYSLEVANLAQSQSLAAASVAELTDVIGTGTLTFRFGTTDYDAGTSTYNSFTENTDRAAQTVTIDNSNNTIEGVRDAINNADIGVSASIVNDGSGYRLLLTSDQQGFDNSLEITVDEGATAAENLDTTGLSQLAFNINAANMSQTQAAQDAEIFVNGLQVFREKNVIGDAIPGLNLTLLSADPGKPTQINVSQDNSQVESNISDFVDAYNELVTTLNGLSSLNTDTGEAGVLLGDTTSQSIIRQIRNTLVKSINTGGDFTTLSSIGITTQRDGSLKLDGAALSDALSSNFDSVAKLFYASGVPSLSSVKYINGSPSTQEGNYGVSVSSLATQGVLSGSSVAGPITIDSSNDSLSLIVDGVSSGTVSLTQASYTDMSVLAQEIENRINASSALQDAGVGVSVAYETDRFVITSSRYGSDSSVSVSLANAALGLDANASETSGSDIVGSIGGLPATGSGQRLTGTGAASGMVLEITGTQTGRLGTVSYSNGMAGNLDSLISRFLADDGLLTTRIDRINEDIGDLADDRLALDKRVAAVEARFRSQFTALDVLMGQLNVTSNFLEQQLSSLGNLNGKK